MSPPNRSSIDSVIEIDDTEDTSEGQNDTPLRRSARCKGKSKPIYTEKPTNAIEEKTSAKKPMQKRVKHGTAKPTSEALPVLPPGPRTPGLMENQTEVEVDNGTTGMDVSVANVDTEALLPDPLSGTKTANVRVKEILRLFTTHYLQLIQEEEKRVKIPGMKKVKKADMKNTDTKQKSQRPDLKAMGKMIENGTVLYHDKMIGAIPGIEVGDQFFSRSEMVVLGIHSHWLSGIDYMGTKYAKMEKFKNKGYTFPLAVCIILSGMYEDDSDNSEDVIYTGQGGHDLLGSKHQIADQKLERGNLALKNNSITNVPVRVVRGHVCKSSYCGKVYTYDGLYQVVKYWPEKGVSGFTVYKYKLRRVPGQPVLTTEQVRFGRAKVPQSISDVQGLLLEDMSGGQENFPIPVTNTVDDTLFSTADFVYSKSIILSKNVKVPDVVHGCGCKGECIDPRICSCARLNGSDFPYVHKDGGRLIEPKAVIFECGRGCKCSSKCVNRTSQQGMKYKLEVFRTANKGWAVRSWDTIPAGAPVCEYTGILSKSDDIDPVSEGQNKYLFDIDCLQTMNGLDGRETRTGCKELLAEFDDKKDESAEYTINARHTGNVARFINHSCQPNLFVQCILASHRDVKMAKIVLFAADTIPPLQELSYDYGYPLDSVVDAEGKVIKLSCFCGAAGCRKRLH